MVNDLTFPICLDYVYLIARGKNTMDKNKINDQGGRRQKSDRRSNDALDSVAEKRDGENRRCDPDRREDHDPVIRITGDERRKAYRDIDILKS